MKKYAIIPARGGSKGLPRKNVRPFCGEPLISRSVRIAKETDFFDSIIVNTDDEEIADCAKAAGAKIVFREKSMGSDLAEVDPLIIWTIKNYSHEFDEIDTSLLSLLYCTAPLRTHDDILQTCNLVYENRYESSLSLCETSDYIWQKNEKNDFYPSNYDPSNRAPRQNENWNQFKENKAVYCFKANKIIEHNCRLYGQIGAHLMPYTRSVDIDTLEEFKIAEAIALIDSS